MAVTVADRCCTVVSGILNLDELRIARSDGHRDRDLARPCVVIVFVRTCTSLQGSCDAEAGGNETVGNHEIGADWQGPRGEREPDVGPVSIDCGGGVCG